MKPFLALVFPLVLLLSGCGPASVPQTIAEIEKLDGRVSLDESGEVIKVSLYGTQITDAGLEHLNGLTRSMLGSRTQPTCLLSRSLPVGSNNEVRFVIHRPV
jgi:hypothetical protein